MSLFSQLEPRAPPRGGRRKEERSDVLVYLVFVFSVFRIKNSKVVFREAAAGDFALFFDFGIAENEKESRREFRSVKVKDCACKKVFK